MAYVFFHIALDNFGAECLGKFQTLDSDIESKDTIHQFVWFNPAPKPSETNYWNAEYPKKWHFDCSQDLVAILEDGYRDNCAEDNRSLIVKRISDAFKHGKALSNSIRSMVNEEAKGVFGQGIPVQIRINLVGSIAHHWGSAAVIGFMQGWNYLYQIAALVNANADLRIIIATGHLTASEGQPIETLRCLSAQGLFDIEGYFKHQESQGHSGAFEHALFVIGDHPYRKGNGDVAPDRAAQVAIAAYGLLGIVQEVIYPIDQGVPLDTLHFQRNTQGALYGNRQSWSASRPFFAIGCYGIRAPRLIIKQAIANKFCAELFEKLAQQQNDYKTLGQASRVTGIPNEKIAFFDSLERVVFEGTYAPFDPEKSIPYNKNKNESPQLFGITGLKQCFTSIFEKKEWKRIIENYGYNRIRALPLEDWGGAIEELEIVIEKGVVENRREELNLRSREVLIYFTKSLHTAIGKIFQKSFLPPVKSKPHETAQLFLGRLDKKLQQEQETLEREGLISNPYKKGRAGKKSVGAPRARHELLSALNEVPSPAAIGLRLFPLFVVAIGIAVGFPLYLGFADATSFRIPVGIAFGGIAGFLFFHLKVRVLRNKLYKQFTHWLKSYKGSIVEFDQELVKEAYYELISHTREILKWYLEGTTQEPSLPTPFGIYWKKQPVLKSINPADRSGVILPPQKILCNFQKYLQESAIEYQVAFQSLCKGIKESIVETALPSDDQIETLYHQCFPDSSGSVDAGKIANWAEGKGDLFALFVPDNKVAEKPASWLYSHKMAPGSQLAGTKYRQKDAGFIFCGKVINYLGETMDNILNLSHQLEKYLALKQSLNLEATPLAEEWRFFSIPPISTAVQYDSTAIGYANNDYFASLSQVRKDTGNDVLHTTIRITAPLSAEEIVFDPNPQSPVNAMGRAYNAIVNSSEGVPFKAIEPVNPGTFSNEEGN